jgi:hypothetical protein
MKVTTTRNCPRLISIKDATRAWVEKDQSDGLTPKAAGKR